MAISASEARRAVTSLGKRGKTTRVPDSVRQIVLDYILEARTDGVPWAEISNSVGISKTAMQRWGRAKPGRLGRVKPVTVKTATVAVRLPQLVLVTSKGDRLEGLGVEQAVAVLRALRCSAVPGTCESSRIRRPRSGGRATSASMVSWFPSSTGIP